MVRDEWAQPMIRANKADIKAFDRLARQERPKYSLTTYSCITLGVLAMVLFVGSLLIALSGLATQWASGFVLTAAMVLLIAVLVGTFVK